MVFVVGVSLNYSDISTKLLPVVIGCIVFVLAAVELYVELVAANKTLAVTQEVPSDETRGEVRRFFSAMGWLIGFFLGIYLLGILLAIPLFIISFLRFRRRGWLISFGLGIIVCVCIYGAFEFALNAPLYRGLIFSG